MSAAWRRSTGLCWLLALAACGCAAVRVERSGGGPSLTAAVHASLPGECTLSSRTAQELYRLDLYRLFPDNLDDLAARLHAEAVASPRPEILFALAEVNLFRGRNLEKEDDPRATLCYFRSAGYAWHYLFGEGGVGTSPTAAFDPRFRLACDLYNTSLARCIVLAITWKQLDARGEWSLPGRDEKDAPAKLNVRHVGFAWTPEEFGELSLCSAYKTSGMGTMQRTFGLGVPLVGQRAAGGPARPFIASDLTFPVTAFCRFEGGVAELTEQPRACMEFINPLGAGAAKVGERTVPLETDLTTPLAHFLGQTYLDRAAWLSIMRPTLVGEHGGLHFFEPYQPGKIPVILVHGLLSSPQTWAPVLNELLGDPTLRARFNFGVCFYPTGEPYLATAADLRRDLAAYRQTFDPQGRDPALSEVVVMGHSMGGLIARLLTVDGGEDFWAVASSVPFDQLQTTPQTHEQLARTYFFRRDPGVTRVVFCGTPHRGSELIPALPGRVAAVVAGVPRQLAWTAREVSRLNPHLPADKVVPTSVALLKPGAPVLGVLSSRPCPEGVRYHSIIGVALTKEWKPDESYLGKTGDGAVSYESAHLECARSELVVQAEHTQVHHHPLAIRELRRILHEHLAEVERKRNEGVTATAAR
jgi:pimeloyl-ACP methyl ester carboxylesterase